MRILQPRDFLELRREARRTGRPTDELIQLCALEGFLDHLAHSGFAEYFVLKGGVLLAALDVPCRGEPVCRLVSFFSGRYHRHDNLRDCHRSLFDFGVLSLAFRGLNGSPQLLVVVTR